MHALQYLAFTVAAPVVFITPGWLWLRRAGVSPLLSLYGGLGATTLVAALVVGLGDLLPWSVSLTCTVALLPVAASAVWCWRTAPRPLLPARRELIGIAAFLAAFIGTAAYVAVPSRPFVVSRFFNVSPGLVDSARWPAAPSDNTLPFRTGQVALHKLGGAQIRDKYSVGWWISDRTPLTGLAFAFAAGAAHVHVSSTDPTTQRTVMTLIDGYGFWAYDIVAMLLNLGLILGAYALAREWLGDSRVAAVASLTTALMPGVFLEAIFTWPKQAVAYFLLMAAAFAIRRRPALCGAFGALGYLCHPAGLWWMVGLALLLFAYRDQAVRATVQLARFAGAALLVVAPWQLFCSLDLHAISRWTYAPLGYLIRDPTHPGSELSKAWSTFTSDGVWHALWVRLQSAAISAFPRELSLDNVRVGGSYTRDIGWHWLEGHGYSFWGLVGLVLFPALVIATVRRWAELRPVFTRFLFPGLITALIGTGFVPPYLSQNAYVVSGVLAAPAAYALLEAGGKTRSVLLAAVLIELLSIAWVVLFRPFNISAGPEALFVILALGCQLALFATLVHMTGGTARVTRLTSRLLANRRAPAAASTSHL
jgi:hypothetical protein